MTHEHFETDSAARRWLELDALVDGEAVDRDALRKVLGEIEARDYLVETLLLRRLTRRMDATGTAVPDAPRAAVRRPLRWIAAAAMVGASVAGGYAYGQQAEAAPASIEVSIDTASAPPEAPEPTRAIRFEPGVNWTTSTGGE
jgi:hypothetical protein